MTRLQGRGVTALDGSKSALGAFVPHGHHGGVRLIPDGAGGVPGQITASAVIRTVSRSTTHECGRYHT